MSPVPRGVRRCCSRVHTWSVSPRVRGTPLSTWRWKNRVRSLSPLRAELAGIVVVSHGTRGVSHPGSNVRPYPSFYLFFCCWACLQLIFSFNFVNFFCPLNSFSMDSSGIFKIKKLSESNFHIWKQKIELVLPFRKLSDHMKKRPPLSNADDTRA